MGTVFYFGMMEMFWNQIEVIMTHNTVNVLNATKLYTLKMVGFLLHDIHLNFFEYTLQFFPLDTFI